jgi:predicted RNA-binding Zn ribbon-like protein
MRAGQQPEFKFIGGHPALDLANTVAWRLGDASQDYLRSYEDLLRWSKQAGLLDSRTAAHLRGLARRSPDEAESVLQRALQVREVTYRLCEAVLHGKRPSAGDVDALNRFVRSANRRAAIRWIGGAFDWKHPTSTSALDAMLQPVIRSAAELLTSDRSDRISQCHDDRGCGWLFLDSSRSRARQWCSMADCGNRAKARRHYHRTA